MDAISGPYLGGLGPESFMHMVSDVGVGLSEGFDIIVELVCSSCKLLRCYALEVAISFDHRAEHDLCDMVSTV